MDEKRKRFSEMARMRIAAVLLSGAHITESGNSMCDIEGIYDRCSHDAVMSLNREEFGGLVVAVELLFALFDRGGDVETRVFEALEDNGMKTSNC